MPKKVEKVEKKVKIKKCKTEHQRDRVCLKFQTENYCTCNSCGGPSELIIKNSKKSKFKKTIQKYCPKCKTSIWICPFCGEKKTRMDHLNSCKCGHIWIKDENETSIRVFKCCDFTFENEHQIYDHIIKNHCDNLRSVDKFPRPMTEQESSLLKSYPEGGVNVLGAADCPDDNINQNEENSNQKDQNEENSNQKEEEFFDSKKIEELCNNSFSFEEFISKIIEQSPKKPKLSCKECDISELGLDLKELKFKDSIFDSEQEIFSFLLINYYGVSSEAYDFIKKMIGHFYGAQAEKAFPCFDTIIERKKDLANNLIEGDKSSKYVRTSIEERIKLMCKDPYLFKHLCLNRDKQKSKNERNQPYHTKIFKDYLKKCPSDAFPFVLLHYMDDFGKFRTKNVSTCGSYFTTYNWDADFINKLEAIQLHGFSSNNIGFWELSGRLMKELNEIEGKVIEVEGPDGSKLNLFICSAAFLWDTVEKLKCLSLMKGECSRCYDMDDWNIAMTPNYLLSSDLDIKVINCKKRKFDEMQEVLENYDDYFFKNSKKPREPCKGLTQISKQEEMLKDQKLSKTKRNQIRKEKPDNTIIPNPFIEKSSFINLYERALVEFFHVEIQGLFRTQLKLLLKELSYGTAIDDLIIACQNVKKPNGNQLKMKSDIDNLSGMEMLDFIICSAPILYDLIFHNSKIPSSVSNEKKTQLYKSWILHLQYFTKISKENLSSDDISIAEKIFVQFRMEFRDLFKEKNCTFPNFHWITHLFSDCREFGEVTWFWALIFELKHSQYKKFNDRSNKKHLEFRALQHELACNNLFTRFPWVRAFVKADKDYTPHTVLHEDMFVCFSHSDTQFIGKLGKISKTGIISLTECYQVDKTLNPEKKLYPLIQVELPIEFLLRKDILCIVSCLKCNNTLFFNHFALSFNYFK